MKIDLSKYIERLRPQVDALLQKAKPLKDYYLRLSSRDQQLVMLAGVLISLMLLVMLISSAIDFRNNLYDDYETISEAHIDAHRIAKQYHELIRITPNDFSSISVERIKSDANQILGEDSDTDVVLADNILTVKTADTKFENALLFLDQLRKSYGLFADKLKITRLSQPGMVSFTASFKNVEQ